MAKIGEAKFTTLCGRALRLFSEQLSVIGAHQSDATSYEANSRVADRGCFPRLGGEPSASEEAFGNRAIGEPVRMGIDSAEHCDDARIWLQGSHRVFALRVAQKAKRRLTAKRRELVERDDCRECLPFGKRLAEPKLVLFSTASEKEMFAVRDLPARAQTRPARWLEGQRVSVDGIRCKQDDARAPVGKPEEVDLSRA